MEAEMEIYEIKELVEHRVKDYRAIMMAISIQDKLRTKRRGKESTEIIREWRDRK